MESKTEDIEAFFQKLSSNVGGLTSSEVEKRLHQFGRNVIEEKRENLFKKIFKYFWGPIPWMIEIAAVLSSVLEHWADLTFIIILLFFNAFVAFFQEYQAGNAIEALKKKLAIKSRTLRDGKWLEIDAANLVPGDIILVRLGDIIPADGILVEGEFLSVDQSALTGESLPVSKMIGNSIFSGSIVQKGEMTALVTKTGKETYFGKTVKLVATAKRVSHFQKAVLQIGDFLIYLSLALVFILFIVQLARGDSLLHILKFSLILTVASIPVAMPAVLSVTMAVGAFVLSKMKAIVTRLESIEEMAGVDVLLCDKTGTLTQNKLTLANPVLFGNANANEVVLIAALASKAESRDLIDLVIIEEAQKERSLEPYTQKKFTPFNPVSKRTEAIIQDLSGRHYEVTKGAPQVILALCQVGQAKEKEIRQSIETFAKRGYRTLGVAKKDEGENWEFLGLIPLYDPPRVDSKETIKQARGLGVEVKMLTGDNLAIGREISSQLGIGENIIDAEVLSKDVEIHKIADHIENVDGFAQVFPENKYIVVKALQATGHLVGMTGDGVNDAPALKQADLGIAVSGATDAARSAASFVLTASGLSIIIRAVEEARRIFERMNTYAIYRITETIRIVIFMVLAILIYNFYPISALMIILLALLNDIPIMTIAYDRTLLANQPVKWDMWRVLLTASVLGGIGVVETFLLLIIAMNWLGISGTQLQAMIFLKLSLAGHLTLFIARTRHAFFKKPFPSPILLGAILGTQLLAVLIVGFGVFFTALPWIYIGFVWGYCLIWMFIEDIAKMLVYKHLELSHTHHQNFVSKVKETFMPVSLRNGLRK